METCSDPFDLEKQLNRPSYIAVRERIARTYATKHKPASKKAGSIKITRPKKSRKAKSEAKRRTQGGKVRKVRKTAKPKSKTKSYRKHLAAKKSK